MNFRHLTMTSIDKNRNQQKGFKVLFDNFIQFSENIALILPNNEPIRYSQLQQKVNCAKRELGSIPQLVFIEMSINLSSFVYYIACIQAKHPILLLSPDNREKNNKLIELYQPNIVIHAATNNVVIIKHSNKKIKLHHDLALLLTTSGSPKLVKLSANNITANTQSIAEYLEFDLPQIM